MDDLEPVIQSGRDGVHVVRGGDEEDPAEVVLDLQVVVSESMIVRGVEHLHQRRRRIAAPVAVEFVQLVQKHHRIVDAGLREAAHDASRHRPDVGAPMPADLGLVAHTAESDAHEGSSKRVGDALRDAALAGARRARQTEDGGRLVGGVRRRYSGRTGRVGPHPADGEVLEDAVLDVTEPVVRALQVTGHAGNVHVRRREPAPGQLEDGVEKTADDRDLRAHGRRLPQLGDLTRDKLARRRRELRLGGALHVQRDVFVGGFTGLLDLVAQHAQLLVQQQLALRALDALLHLEPDLLLDAEHRVLLGEALEQGEKALRRADDLQQRLLLSGLRLQVSGDDVGQLVRVVGLLHDELRLVGELRVQLDVADELVRDPAREAARARRPRVLALDGGVLDEEVRLAGEHALGADALVALHEGLDAAVRQLEELEYPGTDPDGAQVRERRILDGRLTL